MTILVIFLYTLFITLYHSNELSIYSMKILIDAINPLVVKLTNNHNFSNEKLVSQPISYCIY